MSSLLQCASADCENGRVTFVSQGPNEDRIVIYGAFINLAPGAHGFHIHTGSVAAISKATNGTSGGCNCDQVGGHLITTNNVASPYIQTANGGLHSLVRHAGDLGNVFADNQGVALIHLVVFGLTIDDIIGCTIMLHADQDDLGRGSGDSHKTGNSGRRVACATIVRQDFCDDLRFELPDPEKQTYGSTMTVGDAFDLGDNVRDEIATYVGDVESYDNVVLTHDLLAKLFDLFTTETEQSQMLLLDASIAHHLKQVTTFTVTDWIQVLTVATEHESPLVYLYIINLLLRRDDYKLHPPLDNYDVVGYTIEERERIKDTLDFYAQLTNHPVAAHVLKMFVDDGPPINSELLRAPIPLRWVIM